MDARVDAQRGITDVEFAKEDFPAVLGFAIDAGGVEREVGRGVGRRVCLVRY